MRKPGSWRSGVKVVVNTDRGRVSCTTMGAEVNYDEVARRPEGCGPLSVFMRVDYAVDWIEWIGAEWPPWLKDGKRLEIIYCAYRESRHKSLWIKPPEGYVLALNSVVPMIEGIAFADTVVPLRMDEITEIKEISA